MNFLPANGGVFNQPQDFVVHVFRACLAETHEERIPLSVRWYSRIVRWKKSQPHSEMAYWKP